MLVAIAVDIGGTNTKVGVISPEGKILVKDKFSTKDYPDGDLFLQQLKLQIMAVMAKLGDSCKTAGIGIGAPKANYHTGLVEGAANLQWEKPVNLRQYLEDAFEVPVQVTNDANLAAIGEKKYGAAQTIDNFLSVTLGTGVGCGAYLNGQLVHGQSDLLGEVGHTSVKRKGRRCACGKEGCLETYVSVNGIKRTAMELQATEIAKSELRNLSYHELDPNKIWSAALAEDSIALKVLRYTGKILGYKLADLIALFNPEAVFLTGGLTNAGDFLLEPAKSSVRKYLYPSYSDPVRISFSSLKENDISLLGGGALVWDHLEKNLKCLV